MGQQTVQGDIVGMLACINTAVRIVLRPCKGIVQLVVSVHIARGFAAYLGGFQKREVEVILANLLCGHVIPRILARKELQRGQVVIAEFAVRTAHDLYAVVPTDGVIVTLSNSFQGIICGDFPAGHDLRVTGINRHRDDLQVGVAAVKDHGGQVAQHKFRAAAVDRLFHRSKRHILAFQRLRFGCRTLCRIADCFITVVFTHQHNAVVRHGVRDRISGKFQVHGNRQIIRRAAGYDRLTHGCTCAKRRTVDKAAVATFIPSAIVCLGNTDLFVIAGRLHPCTRCICTRGCRGAQAGGRAKAVCYRCLGVVCTQRNFRIGLVHQVGGYLPVARVCFVIACVCQHKILAVVLSIAGLFFQADLQLRGRQGAHEVLRVRLYLITYLGSVHGLYTDTELAVANSFRQRIIRVKQIARAVDLYVFVVFQSNSVRTVNLIQRYQIMAYILYLVIRENAVCGRGRPCHLIAAIDSAAIFFMRNLQVRDRPGGALVQNLRIVVLDQVVRDVLHTRACNLVFFAVPQQDGGNFSLLWFHTIRTINGCQLAFVSSFLDITCFCINCIKIIAIDHTRSKVLAHFRIVYTSVQPCAVEIITLLAHTRTICRSLCFYSIFIHQLHGFIVGIVKAVPIVHKVVAVGHDVFTSTVHRNGCILGTNSIFIQSKTIRDCGGCTRCTAIATVAADTCKQVDIA